MGKLNITAHRGLGPTNKPRNEFIKNADFYPENSIIAFDKAIELGADALECDIQVSKDNIPMVIHGARIHNYAHKVYSDDCVIKKNKDFGHVNDFSEQNLKKLFRLKTFSSSENRLIELNSAKNRINNEIKDLVSRKRPFIIELELLDKAIQKLNESINGPKFMENLKKLSEKEFNRSEIEQNLSALEKEINEKNVVLEDIASNIEKEWKTYSEINSNSNLTQIPSLKDFLLFCSIKNEERLALGKPPLKLNIELKGKNSGYFTLKAIIKHNVSQIRDGRALIRSSDIILLGRITDGQDFSSMGEITIAKEILKNRPVALKQYLLHLESDKSDFQIFSENIAKLSRIRTNVMISTEDLYDKEDLVEGSPDFDVKDSVDRISKKGFFLIQKCITNGYDGIDINLFDFEADTFKALTEMFTSMPASVSEFKPIIGFSASNWRGVESELSRVTPAEAILKAHYISSRLDVEVLLKVDEVGLFRTLYDNMRSNKMLELEPTVIESTKLDFDITEDDILSALSALNYVVRIPENISPDDIIFTRTQKPPRGKCKGVSNRKPKKDNGMIIFSNINEEPILINGDHTVKSKQMTLR